MTKIGPNMGHTFYFIWNQGKPESVFDRIKEVRKMVKTTSNLCNNTNWNIWENPWTKFEEENLWNLNWKCCHVKIGKICYYPGFYSSRNDEMGPNGVHFNEVRNYNISSKMNQVSYNELQYERFYQCN